jgi:hypothetical protein
MRVPVKYYMRSLFKHTYTYSKQTIYIIYKLQAYVNWVMTLKLTDVINKHRDVFMIKKRSDFVIELSHSPLYNTKHNNNNNIHIKKIVYLHF